MISYNGKFCGFKQYMPAKPITHGIKLWCLADAVSKFIINFEVYVGAANERRLKLPRNPLGTGAGVVTCLTHGMGGMWYTVVVDNYFSGPLLFDAMYKDGFYMVGTVKWKRKGFPTSLVVRKTKAAMVRYTSECTGTCTWQLSTGKIQRVLAF